MRVASGAAGVRRDLPLCHASCVGAPPLSQCLDLARRLLSCAVSYCLANTAFRPLNTSVAQTRSCIQAGCLRELVVFCSVPPSPSAGRHGWMEGPQALRDVEQPVFNPVRSYLAAVLGTVEAGPICLFPRSRMASLRGLFSSGVPDLRGAWVPSLGGPVRPY